MGPVCTSIRRWSEKITSFDAYVFVAPEYNHSTSGALKNAIDFLYREWNNKAAGFVSYGGHEGVRAVEHLRLVLAEVMVATVRAQITFSLLADFENFKTFKPGTQAEKHLQLMLDQLIGWGGALNAAGREVEAWIFLRNTRKTGTATKGTLASLICSFGQGALSLVSRIILTVAGVLIALGGLYDVCMPRLPQSLVRQCASNVSAGRVIRELLRALGGCLIAIGASVVILANTASSQRKGSTIALILTLVLPSEGMNAVGMYRVGSPYVIPLSFVGLTLVGAVLALLN